MTITLDLAPDLEAHIRRAAAQVGQAPDAYIVEMLRQGIDQPRSQVASALHLSSVESDLLIRINQSFSHIHWQRYRELVAKRQAESLSTAEQQTLVALSDQIEAANVQRMSFLVELARLRNTSLELLMRQLGLKPAPHA